MLKVGRVINAADVDVLIVIKDEPIIIADEEVWVRRKCNG